MQMIFFKFLHSSIYASYLSVSMLFLLGSSLNTACSQESIQKGVVFAWDQEEQTNSYWKKAINCGDPNQPGGIGNTQGSKITFGVENEVRFPGTQSVEFWTDARYAETCNQNFSAERAEIHMNTPIYTELGAKIGATVWFGWSEMYTAFDKNHEATLFQLRSGPGSPTAEIKYAPEKGFLVFYIGSKWYPIMPLEHLVENQWYDYVLEFTYSYDITGSARLWVYKAGDKDPTLYSLQDRPKFFHKGLTQIAGKDTDPHIRWGVYRWDSADFPPEEILEEDYQFIKYLGPVRIAFGQNLGSKGFDAVKPRPLSASPTGGE
ncbi:MAG: heparin lyase I family protein [Bacteroidota bacterium]